MEMTARFVQDRAPEFKYVTAGIMQPTGQIGDLREEVNRVFDEADRRSDAMDRWFLGLGVPLIPGILAIIHKLFIGP